MTTRLKTWLCGTVLFGAAALSAACWAMGSHPGMGPTPERLLQHLGDSLDLTTEQHTAIESLLIAAKENGATDRKRLQQLREQLTSMRDSFDPRIAHNISEEVGQITARMVYQASETWSQVYRLLDAQQRAQLESLMAKRGKARGRWHGPAEQES